MTTKSEAVNPWARIHDSWAGSNADLYGSKAANLMLLASHQILVPAGVCFSSASLASKAPDTLDVVQSAPSIRMPWAVRSSSLSEDSAGMAFPGIYRTVLGVTTKSLREALASVATGPDEATWVAYAHQPYVPQRIPVVVQTIVTPRAAGVIFTRHPIAQTDSLLINATYGLGKSVVDGTVDPDEFEVSPDGDLRAAAIARKQSSLDASGRVVEVPPELVATPSLDKASLRRLARLARTVEKIMGSPQDIEWVQDHEGQFWIVQSRPITTLDR